MVQDTIVGVATPLGQGGVGIVRLSGSKSHEIAEQMFRTHNNKRIVKPNEVAHRMWVGSIYNQSGQMIDQAILLLFNEPHSYTGEDVVEFQVHGGPVLIRNVVTACLQAGARLATPGEFTKRAFLNGNLDLSQAEAVMDLIAAESTEAQKLATSQLSGSLSVKISRLRQKLMEAVTGLEGSIDYPDEIDELPVKEQALAIVEQAFTEVSDLLLTENRGRMVREGLRIALIGEPNVGKSSLLNALLETDRAIVSQIAGTTRDVLEESFWLLGRKVVLLDTAGLRPTSDVLEILGIERTKQSIKEADLLFWVLDSRDMHKADISGIKEQYGDKVWFIWQKADYLTEISTPPTGHLVSAQTGFGLPELKNDLIMYIEKQPGGEVLVANERHLAALRSAYDALSEDFLALPVDVWVQQLWLAIDALGEITGESARDEVIHAIFARFCLGK